MENKIKTGAITATASTSSYGQLRLVATTGTESSIGFRLSGDADAASWVIGKGSGSIGSDLGFYYGGLQMRLSTTGVATFSSTVNTTSTAASNSTVASNSIYTTGGIGVTGASIFSSTTASSSTSTGAVVISGGLGIGGAAYFGGNVTGLAFFESSSILKKNITKRYKGIDGIDIVKFKWKPEFGLDKREHYGVIAQEAAKVIPDAVVGETELEKHVHYTEVLLYKILQLEERIKKLENKQRK